MFLFVSISTIIAWSGIFVPVSRAFQDHVTATTAGSVPAISSNDTLISSVDHNINLEHDYAVTPSRTPAPPDQYNPDQILVKYKQSIPETQKRLLRGTTSGNLPKPIEKLNIFQVNVPSGQLENMLAKFKQDPNVTFAEPNYIASALDTIPNDPYWSYQYNLVAIRAPQGWDLSTGSSSATIAVVDSGVDLNHPELTGKLVPGYDFVAGDDNPQDEYGHGTHVAGIAAASSNNHRGIAGVSWGAKIMPVRVLDASGNGYFSDVANGIIWAADHGAQVINLSLGGPFPSATLEDAINYALAKDVIVVAASGNNYSGSILYPARYDGVIAVGATDRLNIKADFSNYGNEIDLVAPGVDIYSLAIGNSYVSMSGTSMATPQVAGLAAILVSIPGNQASRVEGQMKSTALDLGATGWDLYYGYGLIQMDAAISLAQPFTQIPKKPKSSSTPPFNLPETGFAHELNLLPAQPVDKTYLEYSNIWLEIPAIAVDLPIVGIPHDNATWDLTWLGQRAGWLNDTAFPTWKGNSVITGHVWDAHNTPGPFYKLNNLRYADQIEIHAWGQVYLYQVRENELISPTSFNTVFQHETLSWLTLLTCEGYDSLQKQYVYRRMVRAVLMDVKTGP
jgi:thermitase